MPITAVDQVDSRTIRFVYPRLPTGTKPCGFGADRYEGILYLDLRAKQRVQRPYEELDCVDARIAGANLPLNAMAGTKAIDAAERNVLLNDRGSCPVVGRMQQSFVID